MGTEPGLAPLKGALLNGNLDNLSIYLTTLTMYLEWQNHKRLTRILSISCSPVIIRHCHLFYVHVVLFIMYQCTGTSGCSWA